MTCPACAAEIPQGARFCPSCGNLLVRTEERRVVTVLFGDLAGFTSLSEVADPEQLKHLVDRCFQRLGADVTAFGGVIDKILGDAILALFGAPTAHEDDPERAVRAAFRMRRSLEAFSAERGLDLRMRIGINTGEVLVGALQAGGDYTAMGDTVNIASRLQTLAEPGEVLVGPATHSATADILDYQARGNIKLRGRDEPIAVFAAGSSLVPPGRRRSVVRSALVGRDAEYSLLRAAIDMSAKRRRAQLVQIIGEAGMGKSRLAEEAAAAAEQAHDTLVLESLVVPYAQADPLHAIGDAIASAAGVGGEDSTVTAAARISGFVSEAVQHDRAHAAPTAASAAADADAAVGTSPSPAAVGAATAPADPVGEITDTVLAVLGRSGTPQSADVDWRAEAASRSLHRLFDGLMRRRAVIIVLGDVHWAGKRLLSFVEQLLRAHGNQPLVVITTARWQPEEERWTVPPGRHGNVVLHLDPLSREATAAMVNELLSVAVPVHVAELLYERSGGNPFFLEEISLLLRDAGAVGAGARPDHQERAIAELPDTLRGLVAARLDALSTLERTMVDNASVVGGGGAIAELLAISAGAAFQPDASAADESSAVGIAGPIRAVDTANGEHPVDTASFERLVDKDMFVVEGAAWKFRSDVVRDVAYSMLTKTARAQRHLHVARWLVADNDEPSGETVALIADHYASAVEFGADIADSLADGLAEDRIAAGPDAVSASARDSAGDLRDTAIDWLGRAGAHASARDSHYAAAQFHGRAVDLLTDDDPRLIGAALGRASARLSMGELPGARADAELARALAASVGDRSAAARGLRVLGEVAIAADEHESADRLLAESLDQFRELSDRREAAESLRLRGFASMRAGDYGRADRSIRDACSAFSELDDETGLAWCAQNMAWLSFEQGMLEEASQQLDAAIDLFNRLGDKAGLATAQGLQAFVLFHNGQRDEAAELAATVHAIVHERGERFTEAMMDLLLASLGLWSGRANDAVARARAAEQVFRTVHSDFGVVQALGLLGRSYAAVGELQRSRTVLTECLQRALDMPGRPLEGFARAVLVGGAVQVGDPETALTHAAPYAALHRPPSEESAIGVVAAAAGSQRSPSAGTSTAAAHDMPAVSSVGALTAPESARDRSVIIGLLDLEVSTGLALLQSGRVEQAVQHLTAVEPTAGQPSAYLDSSLALACAVAGRSAEALDWARSVLDDGTGTYLDVRTALVARALAWAREGDSAEMEAAFEQALAFVDDTDSRLSQAVVRLARAVGHEVLGLTDAAALRIEAENALAQLGARPTGWETAFQAAAGASSSASPHDDGSSPGTRLFGRTPQ